MYRYMLICFSLCFLTSATTDEKRDKPAIYVIGDSTVKNGSGKGGGGLWGWGDFLYTQIDTDKISVKNYARGGRSSRTYISEGLWDDVLSRIRPGDYVIMQFGHNDGGPVNDNFRARGSLKGNGEETEEIDNMLTGKHEIVHTFGWYIRKYITDTRLKGAIPVVCSLIPRNIWENGEIVRSLNDYAKWAENAALSEKAFYIDLNERIADRYEALGEESVRTKFFLTDHTHTTKEGAMLNASLVAKEIKNLKSCKLRKFIKKEDS